VGEEIVAIGSPLSLESTVSSGIVSGIRTIETPNAAASQIQLPPGYEDAKPVKGPPATSYAKYLQITAPISPGSSGGPLFNMAGEVVGITTLYLEGGENLNFAIPINDAKPLLSADSKMQDFPVETEPVKAQTPDATEVLKWIASHMTTEAYDVTANGLTTRTRTTSSLSFQGCRTTVYVMSTTLAIGVYAGAIAPSKSTTTWGPFDLSNLLPDKISQPTPTFLPSFLQIAAVNAIPVVSIDEDSTGEEHTSTQMYSWLRIPFDSPDSADKQAKAWHDAIVECGGKPIPDTY